MTTAPGRPIRTAVLATVLVLGLGGCAAKGGGTTPAPPPLPGPASTSFAAPSPATVPVAVKSTVTSASRTSPASTTPKPPVAVHFATPEAAMRYLAAAYNKNDVAALRKVTDPAARDGLASMRSEAVNLRLDSCTENPGGDYTCQFIHDYPASVHRTGHGHATFLVAPADRLGWYMTALFGCG